jgi:hypothetical protein
MGCGCVQRVSFGECGFEDRYSGVEFFSIGQNESVVSSAYVVDSPPVLARLHLSIGTDGCTSPLLA